MTIPIDPLLEIQIHTALLEIGIPKDHLDKVLIERPDRYSIRAGLRGCFKTKIHPSENIWAINIRSIESIKSEIANSVDVEFLGSLMDSRGVIEKYVKEEYKQNPLAKDILKFMIDDTTDDYFWPGLIKFLLDPQKVNQAKEEILNRSQHDYLARQHVVEVNGLWIYSLVEINHQKEYFHHHTPVEGDFKRPTKFPFETLT